MALSAGARTSCPCSGGFWSPKSSLCAGLQVLLTRYFCVPQTSPSCLQIQYQCCLFFTSSFRFNFFYLRNTPVGKRGSDDSPLLVWISFSKIKLLNHLLGLFSRTVCALRKSYCIHCFFGRDEAWFLIMKLFTWLDVPIYFQFEGVDAFSSPLKYHHPTKTEFQINSQRDSSGISTGESV